MLVLTALLFAASRVVAPVTYHLQSGDLVVDVSPRLPGGHLLLNLGPFGELSWATHKAPLDIEATFLIRRDVRIPPNLEDLRDIRLSLLLGKIPWLLLAGALAAAVIVSDPRRLRPRTALLGAIGTAGFAALLVGATVLTFDAGALDDPRYRGPIQDAPRVLQLIKEARRDLAGVRRNINKTVAGLQRIHEQIALPAAPVRENTTKILVVSDIHNNPVGLLIAQEIVRRFGADGVVNAGDFTDRGSEPEAELFARFGDLGLPHALVGGNHEDRSVLDRARRIPKVKVLEREREDTLTIAGITVLGDTDPNAYSIASDPENEIAREEIPVRCGRLAERMLEVGPEILLVHDPAQGQCAADLAETQNIPLVFVWGHLHRPAYEVRGSVVSVSPGTSGANGIKTGKSAPYGFAFLEFDPTTRELISVCEFLLDGPSKLRQAACHIAPRKEEPE